MNTQVMFRLIAAVAIGFALMLSISGNGPSQRSNSIPYSQFLAQTKTGLIQSVEIEGDRIFGTRQNGERFSTFAPNDPGLIGDLVDSGVTIEARPEPKPSFLSQLFASAFPILLLIGVWIWFMRRQGLGGRGAGGAFGFGQSRARRIEGGAVNVRLSDVAGVDEAKEEVAELVEFLRDPTRFQRLGGTVPRGVLMVGSPGTGKTLLARAIAGEAEVPFFTVSGSDFVEMFVGVGASRVRDLFKQAKESAPCIIFVDEIDAVGRRRGAGLGGGHDEREQTLNQLLVEMDGFEGTEGVIVIAATNRPDVLDPALLRPGRFDRQVVVPLPDVNGRAQILKLHMRKVPIAADVDAAVIARGTPGFSGADLANLVNEAALMAARSRRERVDMTTFEQAKDKILMGAERRSLIMTEEERLRTAYHEAGHAIVGRLVPEHDPVHKVSIIPRGRALGVTMFLPERDRYSATRRRLESEIASLFGGRVAEELIYGADSITTGAENDIERATAIARNMVTKWGFSKDLGPLAYHEDEDEVFLGRSISRSKQLSDETAARVDMEVRTIIDRNYKHALTLLTEHRAPLERIARALVSHETLTSEQIDALMAGQAIEEPRSPDDDAGQAPKNPLRPTSDAGESGRIGGPAEQF